MCVCVCVCVGGGGGDTSKSLIGEKPFAMNIQQKVDTSIHKIHTLIEHHTLYGLI